MGGRPRTTGTFKFTTRPTPPPVPERKASAAAPPTPPPIPPRHPPKSISVREAKSFFESKTSESRKDPSFTPSKAAAINKGASANLKIKQQSPQTVSRIQIGSEEPRPTERLPTGREISSLSLAISRPSTEATQRGESAHATNPYSRAKADNVIPRFVVKTATDDDNGERAVRSRKSPGRSTEFAEESNLESLHGAEISTNVFTEPDRKAQTLTGVDRLVATRTWLDNLSDTARTTIISPKSLERAASSGEFVRRHSAWKSLSTTETDEATASPDSTGTVKAPRPHTGHIFRSIASQLGRETTFDVQSLGSTPQSQQISTFEPPCRNIASTMWIRRQDSRSAPIDQESDANESVRRSRRRPTMSESQDLGNNTETVIRNFGEPVPTANKREEVAARNLSHDGSSSDHSLTQRTSTHAADQSATVGIEEGYYPIEVPDHVDWRGGYGRRKTQDFGFPCARIKPRSTFRNYKAPLQDPGNWIKRACGHFSTISYIEPREEASKKLSNTAFTTDTEAPSLKETSCDGFFYQQLTWLSKG
ncbi:hypothetical protein N0V90_013141 [Kalmusia sp. IMI 367209]|nr:hypothetical protein N0V90_013141 [Kalmusia sp. IMI 367209]